MKRIIVGAIAALTLAAPVSAGSYCSALGELAKEVMRARQIGVPLGMAMQLADGAPAAIRPQAYVLVHSAYSSTFMTTPYDKATSIVTFGLQAERNCEALNVGL
jgi:hypothetical protein